jgi:hypothetical protein
MRDTDRRLADTPYGRMMHHMRNGRPYIARLPGRGVHIAYREKAAISAGNPAIAP